MSVLPSPHRPPSRLSVRSRAWILAGGILLAGLILATLQSALSSVSLTNGHYTMGDKQADFDFPLKIVSVPEGDVTVTFTLNTHALRPSSYYVLVDDCLQAATINGRVVQSSVMPFCDYAHGRILDLGSSLKSGENQVTMLLHNNVGDVGLLLRPSLWDIVAVLPLLILLVAVIAAGTVLVTMLRLPTWMAHTGVLLLSGIVVRCLYMLTSPYWIRSHDADAHLEYMEYLRNHGSIPLPNAGWEFWQPPLYYFLGSVWMYISSLLHLQHEKMMVGLQVGALFLSIVSLLLCAWIAWLVIPEKAKPIGVPVFVALLAFFPGLILQSSQINNDTLSIALAIGAFALLVYWWKRPKPTLRLWLGLSFIISLGFLTKSTAILLLATSFACLFFRKGMSWKKKCGLGVMMLVVVAVVSGWFTVYRIVQNTGQSYIAGNTNTLNGGLAIPNTLPMYTTFNPIAMMEIPYNSPWDDATRRQYFWEYWYRSAFFGEFTFGDSLKILASWTLFFSYVMVVLLCVGLWKMARTRLYESLPFFFLFVFLVSGALLYRVQYPFTPSEDFRFSLGVLAAVAYFCTMGVLTLKQPALKQGALIAVTIFTACCGIFLLSLLFV